MKNKFFISFTFALSISFFMLVCSKSSDPAPKKNLTSSSEQAISPDNPQVLVKTTLGEFRIELYNDKAPITVKNFLKYVDDKFYDGTIFHRIIPNFMIQGGGFLQGMQKKITRAPVKNEADNGLTNQRGTIAMARTKSIDSATAQFFINVVNNTALNHRDTTHRGYGYCVFGHVISGMDVVDKIRNVGTKTVPPYRDVPINAVIIEHIKRVTK